MAQPELLSKQAEETVVLVGIDWARGSSWDVKDSLDELAQLCLTAGGRVLERFICKQRTPHPRYYIGKGKAQQIAECVEECDADTVIFDDDLSSSQGRNLENLIDAKVIDRTQLILDIFAMHATTNDGRLQIDLARLEYLLPRLRRMWTHLERQKGGIGLRGGPGEQQMEVDRRRIQDRIARLRRDLKEVRKHRAEMRRGRRRHGWALVSLVGYTNAGKSTLINKLTGADVATNNQLFVTVDPTTRKIDLPNHQPALITDTVGFIRKLPHHLVEAFKATLEEVVEADLLVHVVDASHPAAAEQIKAVENVLRELGCHEKPVLAVLNKTDRKDGAQRAKTLARSFDQGVVVSARTGAGLDEFRNTLADCLRSRNVPISARIPLSESKLIATIRATGNIMAEQYAENALFIKARVPREIVHLCEPYFVDKNSFPSYKDQQSDFQADEASD